MLTEIDATVLYSAVRLTVQYSDGGQRRPMREVGTGFIVQQDRGRCDARYLVTNRHVVDPDYQKFRRWKLEEVQVSGYFQHPRDRKGVPEFQEVTFLNPAPRWPSAWHLDVAVLPLDGAGVQMEVNKGSGRFNTLPGSALAKVHDFVSGDITVGRQVLMPGYPGLDKRAAHRPILVSGVIATDPRYAAALGGEDYEDQVLCHAFSWEGMSGSPVLCMVPRPVAWDDWDHTGEMKLTPVLAGVNAGHYKVRDDATAGAITRFVRGDVLRSLLAEMSTD